MAAAARGGGEGRLAGSGTLHVNDFERLLKRLAPPLGLGGNPSTSAVFQMAAGLTIPLTDYRVPFAKAVYELVKRCTGTTLPPGEMRDQIERLVAKHLGAQGAVLHDELMTVSMAMTVRRLQLTWRSRMRADAVCRRREFLSQRQAASCLPWANAPQDRVAAILATQAFLANLPDPQRWRRMTGGQRAGADGISFADCIITSDIRPRCSHALRASRLVPPLKFGIRDRFFSRAG